MTDTGDLPNKALVDFTAKGSFATTDLGFILDSEDSYILKTIPKSLMKGDQGEQGIQGIQGNDGADGINGTNGIDGTNGTDGTNGIDGNGIDSITSNKVGKTTTVTITETDATITNFDIEDGTDGVGAGTVTEVTSANTDLTVASGTTTPELTVVSAPKLTTARTIAGVSFDGTANISLNNNAITNGAGYTTNTGDVTLAGTQTLTNKTLTTPIISTISNTGTVTLPTATDTLVGRATTDTLTNKRITNRIGTTTSSATPTINTDNVDMYLLTAQAVDITSFTTNLSGTPTEGQKLWIAITGTAARVIAWGASFEDGAATLPTTTVTTTRLDVGFVWNSGTSKWRCMAKG